MVSQLSGCCGCSLRTSTLAIGIFGILMGFLLIFSCSIFILIVMDLDPTLDYWIREFNQTGACDEEMPEMPLRDRLREFAMELDSSVAFQIIIRFIGAFNVVLDTVLVVGVVKNKPKLVMSWIVVEQIMVVMYLVLSVMFVTFAFVTFAIVPLTYNAGYVVGGILFLDGGTYAYLILVVKCFYTTMTTGYKSQAVDAARLEQGKA